MSSVLLQTDLPGIPLFSRGKVRDVYDLDDRLLIVATDRISAFDVVMPNGITGKGRILTEMSLFWFKFLNPIVSNHLLTAKTSEYPVALMRFADQLEGRSMLVLKACPFKVECVVRGYLAGSAWKEYRQNHGLVCGIQLPPGLRESDRLPEPIFTPATKATTGHDQNISFEMMAGIIGDRVEAEVLKRVSIILYKTAAEHANDKGILIADTKFEFGKVDGEITLIDEVLTPDSSRFWPKDQYEPGRSQNSFDKQFLRDWLDSVGWNHQPPAPALPADIVERTAQKYQEALNRLTA